MDAARFQNMLRTMWNIDRHDLVEHGVIEADDLSTWKAFRDYPHNTAIRMDETRFARLFALIESRQPKHTVPAVGAEFLCLDGEDRSGECA